MAPTRILLVPRWDCGSLQEAPTVAWRMLPPQMLADELCLSPKGTDILRFLLRFVLLCTAAWNERHCAGNDRACAKP